MVIVRLMGGLGNQMFQYAAARRLAVTRQTSLKLDTTWFAGSIDRAYALHPLSIAEAFATPDELRQITGPAAGRGLERLAFELRRRFKIGYHWTWIRERRLSRVDRRVLAAAGNVYLDGYWQSERYFADAADVIRREFTVGRPLAGPDQDVAQRMASAPSVSLHVRRGDYVADARKGRVRSVCTPDYYRRCVALLAERLGRVELFLFSDDPTWVAANLRFDHPSTLVSRSPARDACDELRLMSACRHHIVANSSFSWWGAWLDPRPDKLVLAPRRWMNDSRVDDRDVRPATWIAV